MSRNVLLAFLALAVPGLLFVLWQGLSDAPPTKGAAPTAREAAAEPDRGAPLAAPTAPRADSARDELEAVLAPAEESTAERDTSEPVPTVLVRLRGRVVDAAGQPLSGVPVRSYDRNRRRKPGAELARSDGSGRFAFETSVEAAPSDLLGHGAGFAALRITVIGEEDRASEHVLLSAPAIDLAGRVETHDGARVEGARVLLRQDEALRRIAPLPLDATVERKYEVRADARGEFELKGVPALEGAELYADHADREGASIPAPTTSRRDLVLRLELGPRADSLTGIVVKPSGEPIEGASVRFGFEETRTAADGSFALPLPVDPDADLPLVAGHAKEGVVHLPNFGSVLLAEAPQAPPPTTLVLPGESLSIAGRVVDARGDPLAGWIVSITEGTPATRNMTPPVLVEGFGRPRLGGVPSGPEGTFALEGLLDRSYPMRAYERGTLRCVYLDPIPAGTTDLEIRVPDGGLHGRVAGAVVSRTGLPVAKASVTVGLITSQEGGGVSWISGASTATDEAGRFELLDVPAAHVHLDVGGQAVVPERFLLDHDAPVDDLRVEVARRCHFRATVTGEREGLSIAAVDAAGEPLMIYRFQANGWSGSSAMPLSRVEGVCTVSEDAAAFVLRRGGEIVARRDVVLSAEDVNEIELAAP